MEVHCVSLLGQQQHSYTWRSLLRLSAAAFPCYKRCKLLCALAITLVLISQCLSFWHSQIDQEALRYRGLIRWNVPDTHYRQAAAAKARMPKTQMFQGLTPQTLQQQVPVYVISLARAVSRRRNITHSLAAAGISNYELVDAVDYHNASSVTTETLHRYAHGWRRYMWYQNRTRYSGKVAVDLSHFRLWERIAAGSKPAIILEDDVHLTGNNWTQHLIDVLKQLPVDWDMFYLAAGCCQILGHSNISRHLVPVFGTAGAMAYMMTPAFAKRAVRAAADPWLNTWVDLILQLMGRHLESNQYLAQPPMVLWGHLPSTLTHYTEAARDSWWERLWMRYRHLSFLPAQ